MKTIIIIPAIILSLGLSTVKSIAQNNNKTFRQELITDFMDKVGSDILMVFGNIDGAENEARIEVVNLDAIVRTGNGSTASTCKISFTEEGMISKIKVINPNSDQTGFTTCRVSRKLIVGLVEKAEENEKNAIIKDTEYVLGKSFEDFDCDDFALLGLNYLWRNKGMQAQFNAITYNK